MRSANTAIFAYGSLMIAQSFSKAVGRSFHVSEFMPAVLCGYRRAWRASVPVFAEELGREIDGIFLDLRRARGRYVNGLLAAVTASELQSLELREAQYRRIDVSHAVWAAAKVASIYTFVTGQPNRRLRAGFESMVPASYLARIEAACSEIGEDFLAEFRSTTDNVTVPSFSGSYTFLNEEQAKRV